MATLALSAIGSAAGSALLPGGFSFLGATLTGAALGRAVGALAGAYIDQSLFGATGQEIARDGPRLADLNVTASTEGADMPRLYGRARLGGQIIWATNFEEEVTSASAGGSGKGLNSGGGASRSTYRYFANFAVALCEGEITRLGRVWADGDEITLSDYIYRVYTGSETQAPDSLIEAKEGAGNAPAYRGTAYVVFERLPLEDFGNRIPQLNFEVFRAVDAFEGQVRGMTLIPAAGEFAYHPGEVRVDAGGGGSYSENRHTTLGPSDFAVSMDQLQATLPNCGAISLFSAWFGSDLRCGACEIKPKVDSHDKGEGTTPISWGVAGLTRAAAEAVSTHGVRPAYGGTPSDKTIIAAIADLSARGFDVIFTPFLLMDIPEANGLADPYTGGADQPAFPWRGRITCDPAPGEIGSPDQTSAAQAQIDAFVGTAAPADFSIAGGAVIYSGPDEWSYRRFILHCAELCAAAGGVDAFVIGSEMRGLTWVRDSASSYPFVLALIALAADVKTILPGAKVTYAADWSEYFGHQPADGSGDVHFHLDPLWSDANIDAVAIDNYWPLSDWRDGTDHLDYAGGTRFIHDLDYLKANIEGGEGFDFFYASEADRAAQIRTPITDAAYAKPWVFRFKDLRSWWSQPHFDRPGGVESGTPTGWVPEGKPIWFTELGCPAVDKGSNQPNVFYDPKSSESFFPHFSRGIRDDLIQRRYLRAFLEWYDAAHADFAEAQNPASGVYDGRMVDAARIMLYTWDARPYPAFPALRTVWSDGDNWQLGHWLTGRVSDAPLAETVAKLLGDHGFSDFDAGQLAGAMAGYVIDRVMSARDALQPLEAAFFFDSFEAQGRIRFAHRGRAGIAASLTADELVETSPSRPRYELTRAQESDLPRSAKVIFIDGDRDYQQGSAEGRRISGNAARIASARLPMVTTYQAARGIAETMVQETWASRERGAFVLPPSRIALDASDVVSLDANGRSVPLRLTGLTVGEGVEAEAMSIEPQLYDAFASPVRAPVAAAPAIYGQQLGVFLDLPLIRGDEVAHAGTVAAFGDPWPGSVAFYRSPTTSGFALKALATTPAVVGVTDAAFYDGPTSRWDEGNSLRVVLSAGELSSAGELLVLGGANVCAVENADGAWEVVQFRDAALIGARTYELTGLLRGQAGTEGAMRAPVAAGARFVLLNGALVQVDMAQADIGLAFNWKYGPSRYDIGDASYRSVVRAFDGVGLRPLSPVHVGGRRVAGGLEIAWVRRTRIGGDGWDQLEVPLGEDAEAYEVDVMDGAAVVRTLAATTPLAVYTDAEQTADFGAPQAEYTVRVYQLGASYGRGAVREALVP
ncbi:MULTISPECIES: glycoside hydrolase/phage tail family protein [Rhodomicrobium]|uniref:baseplate multidomain protein megatron n=1 Tax=Rhodomicrobium TaxID=1068 RepID=UPI000B4B41FC|nr:MULTISPECIES: glycoside hydrolase/phage tail family protein [Rhodomicrobium]